MATEIKTIEEANQAEAELLREAWAVQDACNLSGVVKSFATATSRLWEICHVRKEVGTQFVNEHPVSVLYSDKIRSLTGSDVMERFSAACDKAMAVKR